MYIYMLWNSHDFNFESRPTLVQIIKLFSEYIKKKCVIEKIDGQYNDS